MNNRNILNEQEHQANIAWWSTMLIGNGVILSALSFSTVTDLPTRSFQFTIFLACFFSISLIMYKFWAQKESVQDLLEIDFVKNKQRKKILNRVYGRKFKIKYFEKFSLLLLSSGAFGVILILWLQQLR